MKGKGDGETAADLYTILGVAVDADGDAIKKAWRDLARRHHPDLPEVEAEGSKGGVEWHRAQMAYSILNDPEKRRQYDEAGRKTRDRLVTWATLAEIFGEVSPSSILEQFQDQLFTWEEALQWLIEKQGLSFQDKIVQDFLTEAVKRILGEIRVTNMTTWTLMGSYNSGPLPELFKFGRKTGFDIASAIEQVQEWRVASGYSRLTQEQLDEAASDDDGF